MSSEDSKVPRFDVFISYSTEDKAVADAVVSAHEKVGIRCWYAPRDIPPGADWGDAIIRAIERCSLMVLVFSGNADRSQRVLDELNYAISEGKPILPFRVEDLEPTGAMRLHLSSRHWLDAYHPSWEAHIERLIESVSLNLGTSYERVQISEAKPAVAKGKEKRFKIPSLPKAVYGAAGILILAGLVYFGWKSFGKGPSSAEPHTSPTPAGVDTTPSQDTISFEDSKATAVAGTKAAMEVIETQDAISTERAIEKATDTPMPNDTPTLTPTSITTPTPISGSLLLEDSFLNNKHGWSTGKVDSDNWEGSREIADGKYTWTVDRSFGVYAWQYPNMDAVGDFYVAVEAQKVSGYYDDVCYGIYFRVNPENRYVFIVCNDEYGVLSFDEGNLNKLIYWNESDRIKSGEKNKLAVAGRGSHFEFYINDTLVDDLTDRRFTSGYVGIGIRVRPGGKATFEFDNFELWLLE